MPSYTHAEAPPTGTTTPVAPGVRWLRMPLPFALDHINLWLLEDGDAWTLVDSGISTDDTRRSWEVLFATEMAERPLGRLIVTHHHPDHLGLAGWLTERWGCPLWMTREEWLTGRLNRLDEGTDEDGSRRRFYRAQGADEALVAALGRLFAGYRGIVGPIPGAFRRIVDGETLSIGGRDWRVIVGTGHAPEHACLWCAETGTLIAGDQVLPRISTNVSVWNAEPEADPLRDFLDSLDRLAALPEDTLVLPSHGLPFRGLHRRIAALVAHHEDRLAEVRDACDRPRTAVEMVPVLFRRALDAHQQGFALGETLAHLNYLVADGELTRVHRDDGCDAFLRTAATATKERRHA